MAPPYADLLAKLTEAATTHAHAHGALLLQRQDETVRPLLEWLDYLHTCETTGTADVMLDGVKWASVEAAGCLALGLIRPALLSIRAEIDMLLAWLYFKDHPAEWDQVEETGEGFKMKRDIIQYCEKLTARYPRFKERFGLLEQSRRRRERDPYHLLSAHIHSQGTKTVPTCGTLEVLVINPKTRCEEWMPRCEDVIAIQSETCEFLNDVLFACFADKWASLPEEIRKDTLARMSASQRRDFFFARKR